MEDKRMNEVEEIETENEVNVTSENSNSGAMLAGIVGGFIAYGIITVAKKARTIVEAKLAAKKEKENAEAVTVDYTEVEDSES